MQTTELGQQPAEVLLVEDNSADVKLTRIGFERARFAVNLHHTENGAECLSFLRKEGPYAHCPTPDIILLDLNMPVMGGHQVLEELLDDAELRHVPVVVLTTSAAKEDVLRSYQLKCSAYARKPVDFKEFLNLIDSLGEFYFSKMVLPQA